MKKLKLTKNDELILKNLGFDEDIISYASKVIYQKGEYLCQEGIKINNLCYITKGITKICTDVPGGRTLLIDYGRPNTYLGELEIFTEKTAATTTITALQETESLEIPLYYCRQQVETSIKLLKILNTTLSFIVKRNTINSAMNILTTVEERLCAYMEKSSVDGVFNENLTNVASMLGSSYRHLLRTISNLCDKKIIEKTKKGYRIINMAELKRIGAENYLYNNET